jgi:putative zinc finger protein
LTHEQAMPLVSDWARGALDADRSRAVEEHVRICVECQAAAEAAGGLHAEAVRLARTPSAHPSSDALAQYVSEPQAASIATLARVGAHVRGCEPCGEDVALMREASRPAWWRAVRAAWDAPGSTARWLQPALAVCALLLAFPAWRGLVELPREHATAERRVHDADAARSRAEDRADRLTSESRLAIRGGGVAALVLQGAARAAGPPPTLRLRSGQLLQPVLLDVSPPAGELRLQLVRANGTIAWSAGGPREEFWDEANRLIGLLVPTAALTAGEYRIEARRADDPAPFFTARFRVESPTD